MLVVPQPLNFVIHVPRATLIEFVVIIHKHSHGRMRVCAGVESCHFSSHETNGCVPLKPQVNNAGFHSTLATQSGSTSSGAGVATLHNSHADQEGAKDEVQAKTDNRRHGTRYATRGGNQV